LNNKIDFAFKTNNDGMKKTALIFCLIILASNLFGQEKVSNQTTSLCGGRWEFFMSEIAAKITFKIDKFTGEVFVLAQRKDKTSTWELIKKEENSKDFQKPDVINYQLFSSGLTLRHTYLLNTNTGLTWQLVTSENGSWAFQAIE
jgi:hypothetical protein